MKRFFGFLNYGCTWVGLFQLVIGAVAAYGAYCLLVSSEPLFLRIVGAVVCAFGAFGCIAVYGVPRIIEGIKHNKYQDGHRLFYRE